MQMKIIKSPYEIIDLISFMEKFFEKTRFNLIIEVDKRKNTLVLRNIRLKEKKPYCGRHPGPCVNVFEKKIRRNYLEGLDWVEFNDLLNNFCDNNKISADIKSAVCKIRRGFERRIAYFATENGPNPEWDKEGKEEHWKCFVGKVAPISSCFEGTPGVYKHE